MERDLTKSGLHIWQPSCTTGRSQKLSPIKSGIDYCNLSGSKLKIKLRISIVCLFPVHLNPVAKGIGNKNLTILAYDH